MWQRWFSGCFLRGTWRHRTSSPEGWEVQVPLAGPDAQAPWGSGFHMREPMVAVPEHLDLASTWRRWTC
jgi:hypothetical protein